MSERQFWAQRGKSKVGPRASREEALAAFRKAFYFRGTDAAAQSKRWAIMTGYGSDGPWFDMRWHDAREVTP